MEDEFYYTLYKFWEETAQKFIEMNSTLSDFNRTLQSTIFDLHHQILDLNKELIDRILKK